MSNKRSNTEKSNNPNKKHKINNYIECLDHSCSKYLENFKKYHKELVLYYEKKCEKKFDSEEENRKFLKCIMAKKNDNLLKKISSNLNGCSNKHCLKEKDLFLKQMLKYLKDIEEQRILDFILQLKTLKILKQYHKSNSELPIKEFVKKYKKVPTGVLKMLNEMNRNFKTLDVIEHEINKLNKIIKKLKLELEKNIEKIKEHMTDKSKFKQGGGVQFLLKNLDYTINNSSNIEGINTNINEENLDLESDNYLNIHTGGVGGVGDSRVRSASLPANHPGPNPSTVEPDLPTPPHINLINTTKQHIPKMVDILNKKIITNIEILENKLYELFDKDIKLIINNNDIFLDNFINYIKVLFTRLSDKKTESNVKAGGAMPFNVNNMNFIKYIENNNILLKNSYENFNRISYNLDDLSKKHDEQIDKNIKSYITFIITIIECLCYIIYNLSKNQIYKQKIEDDFSKFYEILTIIYTCLEHIEIEEIYLTCYIQNLFSLYFYNEEGTDSIFNRLSGKFGLTSSESPKEILIQLKDINDIIYKNELNKFCKNYYKYYDLDIFDILNHNENIHIKHLAFIQKYNKFNEYNKDNKDNDNYNKYYQFIIKTILYRIYINCNSNYYIFNKYIPYFTNLYQKDQNIEQSNSIYECVKESFENINFIENKNFILENIKKKLLFNNDYIIDKIKEYKVRISNYLNIIKSEGKTIYNEKLDLYKVTKDQDDTEIKRIANINNNIKITFEKYELSKIYNELSINSKEDYIINNYNFFIYLADNSKFHKDINGIILAKIDEYIAQIEFKLNNSNEVEKKFIEMQKFTTLDDFITKKFEGKTFVTFTQLIKDFYDNCMIDLIIYELLNNICIDEIDCDIFSYLYYYRVSDENSYEKINSFTDFFDIRKLILILDKNELILPKLNRGYFQYNIVTFKKKNIIQKGYQKINLNININESQIYTLDLFNYQGDFYNHNDVNVRVINVNNTKPLKAISIKESYNINENYVSSLIYKTQIQNKIEELNFQKFTNNEQKKEFCKILTNQIIVLTDTYKFCKSSLETFDLSVKSNKLNSELVDLLKQLKTIYNKPTLYESANSKCKVFYDKIIEPLTKLVIDDNYNLRNLQRLNFIIDESNKDKYQDLEDCDQDIRIKFEEIKEKYNELNTSYREYSELTTPKSETEITDIDISINNTRLAEFIKKKLNTNNTITLVKDEPITSLFHFKILEREKFELISLETQNKNIIQLSIPLTE